MSFYIRDISATDYNRLCTNADLTVTQGYCSSIYELVYKRIYMYDDNANLYVHVCKELYENHNNDLLLLDNIDIKKIKEFIDIDNLFKGNKDKKYTNIEISFRRSCPSEEINKAIDETISLYKDSEINIGFIIDNPLYFSCHEQFLLDRGIYISKYIPQSMSINNTVEYGDDENRIISYIHSDFLPGYDELADPRKVEEACNIDHRFKKDSLSSMTPVNRPHFELCYCCKNKPHFASADIEEDYGGYTIEDSFSKKLIKYLNKSNKTNVEIYTKGGITRKLFSKIISNKNYNPTKGTICCLIIGMELCLDDALDLLNAAGYTLTNSLLSDVIIKKHITNKKYDIDIINNELDEHGLTILGWKPREEI